MIDKPKGWAGTTGTPPGKIVNRDWTDGDPNLEPGGIVNVGLPDDEGEALEPGQIEGVDYVIEDGVRIVLGRLKVDPGFVVNKPEEGDGEGR